MSSLLHVIANPKLQEQSVSRRLAAHFIRARRAHCPEETIETLDLYCEDVPRLDAYTASLFTAQMHDAAGAPDAASAPLVVPPPPEDPLPSWSMAASDRFTAQFLRCQRIVLTAPLWNFGPPAILKAWIDLIVRAGHTFEYGAQGIRPLCGGKRMLIIGARGGVYSGDSPWKAFEMFEPYLRTIFSALGVAPIESVWAEATAYPESPAARDSYLQAREKLASLAETF